MPDAIELSDPLENLGLKDKSQEELLSDLLEKPGWSEEDKLLVSSAYTLALELHKDDTYRDQPYIYHLLRAANRVTGYLRIFDAELVAAALLHDSVEDHSPELTGAGTEQQNSNELQQAALQQIASRLTPRVAELVALVTNEADRDKHLSQDQKIAAYSIKVKQAIQTVDGWVLKFVDWCDNGVGINHASELVSSEDLQYFLHKYGGDVLESLESRFHEADIQAKLDAFAKGYVIHEFELAHTRLPDNEAIAEEEHRKRNFIRRIFGSVE